MVNHSGTLTWEIPWTEEPGGLQSVESQSVNMTERLTLSRYTVNKYFMYDIGKVKCYLLLGGTNIKAIIIFKWLS